MQLSSHPASNIPAAIQCNCYRTLLHNVETDEVYRKSGVSVLECCNCGHIVIGTETPDVCPVCFNTQAYFEINAENY